MNRLLKSFFGLTLGVAFSLGVAASLNANKKDVTKTAEAVDTQSCTVYYAVQTASNATYKVNINTGNGWPGAYNMVKQSFTYKYASNSTTYDVYAYTFDNATYYTYNLQFQTFINGTWNSQQEPINKETVTSTFDGKLYVHNIGWKQQYTVTKYGVWSGSASSLDEPEMVFEGQLYSAPKGIFRENNAFEGWYTTSALSTSFSSTTISNNLNIYGKYTYHDGGFSGSINIDFKASTWSEANANYAVYFYDDSTYTYTVSGWSSYVGLTAGTTFLGVGYNFNFEPKNFIIMRYNPSYSEASWKSDPWNTSVWGRSYSSAITEYITITVPSGSYNEFEYYWNSYIKVDGQVWNEGTSSYGSWHTIADLKTVSLNSDNHACYYGVVTLEAKTNFGLTQNGNPSDFFKSYTAHPDIADCFENGGSSNIDCKTAGTYYFYFDSYTGSVYISSPEAEANDWGETFIGSSGITCDGGTTKPNTSKWSSMSTSFGALKPLTKAVFTSISAGGDESGSDAEKAVARYDYIIKKYGKATYSDFMGRIAAGKLSASNGHISPLSIIGNDKGMMIVIVISSLGILSIGAYYFFKKSKKAEE